MTTTKQSTFGATLRTTILLASLSGLFVAIGFLIGGSSTALLFLGMAALMNMGAYFFSDKLALKMSGAKPIDESEAPRLYQIMRELTTRAGLPMPRMYMIPQDQPNAFATGRNPKNSAVAVTQGITKLLSEDELRGVLAHELAHIKHRDILIQSVAATIGAAITYLGYMLMWFGGGEDNDSPFGLIAMLALILLAPIAATIIQLSISRQREYAADAGGAAISGNPGVAGERAAAARAGRAAIPMQVNQAAEPLYIVKPFSGGGFSRLFSTHPPIEERVRRLRQMRPSLG